MPKAKELLLPKTAGATADALYDKRTARLKLEAEAERLKEDETKLKAHLFKQLPKIEATSITGKKATVTLERNVVPSLKDWDELIKFCVKKKAWDLLTHKVNAKAWRERNDAKVKVGGVEAFVQYKIHCNKK